MRNSAPLIAFLTFALILAASAEVPCRYLKSRSALAGYEIGGPYKLDHFKLTKGRTDLRDFLWTHWHKHIKGVAEAKVGTVDAGTVTVLYVVQPDMQGHWGIDVELDRPMRPPCSTFHADSLVRVPIDKPDDDNHQTLLYIPDGVVPPEARLPDSSSKDAKYYKLVLMTNDEPLATTSRLCN